MLRYSGILAAGRTLAGDRAVAADGAARLRRGSLDGPCPRPCRGPPVADVRPDGLAEMLPRLVRAMTLCKTWLEPKLRGANNFHS